MKSLKTIFLCLLVIFFMPIPRIHASEGQLLADEINQEKARINVISRPIQSVDSLGIFPAISGQYYVYCKVCPIQTSNGFIVMAIIDTIKFIDPDITQKDWINAYVAKNYIYSWQGKLSTVKIEGRRLTLSTKRDESHAVLVNDSIRSFTLLNIQQNSASEKISEGKLLLIILFIWGLIVGLYSTALRSLAVKFLVLAIGLIILTLFLESLMNSTLITLSVMLVIYLSGNSLMILFCRLIFSKKE